MPRKRVDSQSRPQPPRTDKADPGAERTRSVWVGRWSAFVASRWFYPTIFAIALLVRLSYLLDSRDNPTFSSPIVDSRNYDRMALNMVAGNPPGKDVFWQACFYPFFLAAAYSISGKSILFVKLIQVSLGAVTCALTARLAERVFDRTAALIAGVMAALYGPMIFFDGELLATTWAAFWSVALILLFLWVLRNPTVWRALVIGLAGGLSVITRPTFLPFLGICFIGVAIHAVRRLDRRAVAVLSLAGMTAGFAAIALPVALVTYHVTDRFSFLPESGPLNLYMGNEVDSRGVINRPGLDWDRLRDLPMRYGATTDAEKRAYFADHFLAHVREHPGDFMAGLVRKAVQMVCSRETPINLDIYVMSDWSTLLHGLVFKIGPFGFPFGVLFPLVIVGLWVGWRRLPWPMIAFLILYPAAIILVHVSDRYRLPVIPVVITVGACGAVWIGRSIIARRWPAVLGAAAVMALVAVSISVAGSYPLERIDYRADLHYWLGRNLDDAGDAQAAAIEYEAALDKEIDHPDANICYGVMLAKRKVYAPAQLYLERARSLRPDEPMVHRNLALVRLKQGRLGEAIARAKALLALRPSDRVGYQTLAIAYRKQRDYQAAARAYRKALTITPNDASMHQHYGEMLNRLGRYEEAIQQFETAVRLRPDWVPPMNNLAWALATHRDPNPADAQRAVALAARACERTSYRDFNLLDTLAASYAAAGTFDKAVEYAEQARRLALESGQVQLAAGIADRIALYQRGEGYREHPPAASATQPAATDR